MDIPNYPAWREYRRCTYVSIDDFVYSSCSLGVEVVLGHLYGSKIISTTSILLHNLLYYLLTVGPLIPNEVVVLLRP